MEEITSNWYDHRVKKGAILLDQVVPGWFDLIDTDLLDMTSDTKDILGQIYGDFKHGFWIITRPLPSDQLFSAADHGFTLYDNEQDTRVDDRDLIIGRFKVLEALWKQEICTHRQAQLGVKS
jgi:hypothetical protein